MPAIGALRQSSLPRIRVTEEERAEAEKRAKQLDMSLTDYIRHCINIEQEVTHGE